MKYQNFVPELCTELATVTVVLANQNLAYSTIFPPKNSGFNV